MAIESDLEARIEQLERFKRTAEAQLKYQQSEIVRLQEQLNMKRGAVTA
jgi:hypothetical protein